MAENYKHKMRAHCESGTASALLTHGGFEISEAMCLGISGAMMFGYFKTKNMPFPTIAVRNQPIKIFKELEKQFHISFNINRTKDPSKAADALDLLVSKGSLPSVQVDFFYMSYIPKHARAHFNGHFVIVTEKTEEGYIVSDPYAPVLAPVSSKNLKLARHAKGDFAPKGLLIHVDPIPQSRIPSEEVMKKAIKSGITKTCKYMLKVPMSFIGVSAIRKWADDLDNWSEYCEDSEMLSHRIMMINVLLEDRGTGGGGFRYMYASFLQEAAELFKSDELEKFSSRMMENGDKWRAVSLHAARMGKKRDFSNEKMNELKQLFLTRADEEEALFTDLLAFVKGLK
jgi:hypothetical protein